MKIKRFNEINENYDLDMIRFTDEQFANLSEEEAKRFIVSYWDGEDIYTETLHDLKTDLYRDENMSYSDCIDRLGENYSGNWINMHYFDKKLLEVVIGN